MQFSLEFFIKLKRLKYLPIHLCLVHKEFCWDNHDYLKAYSSLNLSKDSLKFHFHFNIVFSTLMGQITLGVQFYLFDFRVLHTKETQSNCFKISALSICPDKIFFVLDKIRFVLDKIILSMTKYFLSMTKILSTA